jgi:hypothetical protein
METMTAFYTWFVFSGINVVSILRKMLNAWLITTL